MLVATDLASRGIDVADISHIINYDIPEDPEVYVHRVGRTARMGAAGKAFTFVTKEQGDELTKVEALINMVIPQRRWKASPPTRPRRLDRRIPRRRPRRPDEADRQSLRPPLHRQLPAAPGSDAAPPSLTPAHHRQQNPHHATP